MKIPYLSGILTLMDIRLDSRCETAGIFPSGRMIIGTKFFDSLITMELAFILAHEALHLVLKSNDRSGTFTDRYLVNVAHDLIINDILCQEFSEWAESDSDKNNIRPPQGGLFWADYMDEYNEQSKDWKPVNKYSLEELVHDLMQFRENIPKKMWRVPKEEKILLPPSLGLGDLIAQAQKKTQNIPEPQEESDRPKLIDLLYPGNTDVYSEELEEKLFSEEGPRAIQNARQRMTETVNRSFTEKIVFDHLKSLSSSRKKGRGSEAGNASANIDLLRGMYRTPWECALQRWFDTTAPGQRSWARPSRRGAFRTDVVLPGRTREARILHIILDTSGSMMEDLQKALGAIERFCQDNNVEQVHLLQCDVGITSDEIVEIGQLEQYEIKGFGGSDMSPAMLRLADDPEVEAVIVLTDGYVDYPEESMPYHLLWCLVETDPNNVEFNYGTVVPIDVNTTTSWRELYETY